MRSRDRVRRVPIGRLSVDALSFDEALDSIERLVESGRGGVVFTPNVDHVVLAEHNERFRRAYARANLCLPDGMPILWAARVLGRALPSKVSGADVVLPIVERARDRRWRLYLLGGGGGVAVRAGARMRALYPGVRIVGFSAPAIDMREPEVHRAAVLEDIRRSHASLVLVALGAPKQELFIEEAASALPSVVFVGVGGSLDFVSGAVARAPAWMSHAGLEWLYRLSREPRRLWRRYLVRDPAFALIVARQWASRHQASDSAAA